MERHLVQGFSSLLMTPCSQGLNNTAPWFQERIPIKDIPVTAQRPCTIYNSTSVPSLSLPRLFPSLSTRVIPESSLSSASGYRGPSCQIEQNRSPRQDKKKGSPQGLKLKTFWGATRLFHIPTSEFVGASTWLSSFVSKSVSVNRISSRRGGEEE